MDTNTTNLESLLKEKKFDEAKKVIEDEAKTPMTEAEKGAAITGMVEMYLDTAIKSGEEHEAALKDIMEGVSKVNAAESKAGDKVKLAEVKTSLNIDK